MPRSRTWQNSRFTDVLWSNTIRRIGEDVLWYRATLCSCSPQGDPNRANMNCKVCRGFGVVYDDTPKWIKIVVTQITRERRLMEEGFVYPGDLIVVLEPRLYEYPSDWDKIVFAKDPSEAIQNEVLTRGMTQADSLTYEAVRVERVVQHDPVTGIITTYVEGQDYYITGAAVTWYEAHGPKNGQQYTIKYFARPEWIVAFQPPAPRWEAGTDLSPKLVLRQREAPQRKKKNE